MLFALSQKAVFLFSGALKIIFNLAYVRMLCVFYIHFYNILC